MEFIKIDENKVNFLNNIIDLKTPGETYLLKDNDKTIGCSRINEKEEECIYIYVLEEYRSRGYGKELFKLSLEKIKHPEIILTIPKKNTRMNTIISEYPNVDLVNDPKYITYKIKTKK